MKNKNIALATLDFDGNPLFHEFKLTWTIPKKGEEPKFDIVDLDGNPYKISGLYTFKCDCPTSQLMTKGCTCGGL